MARRLGIAVFPLLAWILSENRRHAELKGVAVGIRGALGVGVAANVFVGMATVAGLFL